MFSSQNGDRSGIPNVAIVITDGVPNVPNEVEVQYTKFDQSVNEQNHMKTQFGLEFRQLSDLSLAIAKLGHFCVWSSRGLFLIQGRRMTIEEANRARTAGIRVYAIGVGPEATQEVLDQIANQPSAQHTFRVDQFQELDDIIKRVSTATCQVVAAGTGESSMGWSHCSSCSLRLHVVCFAFWC